MVSTARRKPGKADGILRNYLDCFSDCLHQLAFAPSYIIISRYIDNKTSCQRRGICAFRFRRRFQRSPKADRSLRRPGPYKTRMPPARAANVSRANRAFRRFHSPWPSCYRVAVGRWLIFAGVEYAVRMFYSKGKPRARTKREKVDEDTYPRAFGACRDQRDQRQYSRGWFGFGQGYRR